MLNSYSIINIKEEILSNYARQGVVAAQGYDAINRIYGVSTPSLYADFSISQQGVITATFRNSRIYGRSITLTPNSEFKEWLWMSDLDQEYLPFRKGDKITEIPIASSPESNNTVCPKDDRSIVLQRQEEPIKANGDYVAPGFGKQTYTIFQIDTRIFDHGTLVIDITVGNGESDASFDLFPENVPIPTKGRPHSSVAGAYDIPRNSKTSLVYKFTKGQVFSFGATGNWFSKKGTKNTFSFAAKVD